MKNKLIYEPKKTLDVFLSATISAITTFIVVALVLGVFFTLTHIYYNVKGTSMEPNILQKSSSYAGDICWVEKDARFTYGDIIVAEINKTKNVVKRVIAMGEDSVGYYYNTEKGYYEILLIKKDGAPTILEENYLFEKVDESEQLEMLANNRISYYNFQTLSGLEDYNYNGQVVKVLSIPENHLFLLGDNRATSIDSSSYGAIHENKVTGKVVLIAKQDTFPVWEILAQSINKLLGI